jgi:hypothetical protein
MRKQQRQEQKEVRLEGAESAWRLLVKKVGVELGEKR